MAIGAGLKRLLKLFVKADRPFLLEGPTGVGKSEVVEQVAAELGIECLVLNLSLLEPPDLIGLPQFQGGKTAHAPPHILPTGGEGLIVLEELNRAERYTQNPALLLLTKRALHEYRLPPDWVPCAAINPEEGDYLVQPLDAAMRSRFAHIVVYPDGPSWIEWAEARGVHPAVVRLAKEHSRFLEDVAPRKWADVSKTLRAASRAELADEGLIQAALSADLPRAWAIALTQTLATLQEAGRPEVFRLLTSYHTSAELQREVRGHREQGRTDVLDGIAQDVLELVDGPMLSHLIGNKQFDLGAFEALLADLPGDRREHLQERLGDNLAAAPLIADRPGDVVRQYPGSHMALEVQAWAASPLRRHRARLLANLVTDHLQRQDAAALSSDRGALTGLGLLVSHLGESAAPILRLIDGRGIRPVFPKNYRRPAQ